MEVHRGSSKNPLYISAVGYSLDDAVGYIGGMKGGTEYPQY